MFLLYENKKNVLPGPFVLYFLNSIIRRTSAVKRYQRSKENHIYK